MRLDSIYTYIYIYLPSVPALSEFCGFAPVNTEAVRIWRNMDSDLIQVPLKNIQGYLREERSRTVVQCISSYELPCIKRSLQMLNI